MIKFENVSVTYPGGVEALKDLNLKINEGDFLIIVGLSGAGKSTLLRTINNLVKPSNGVVFLDNKDITNANNAIPITIIKNIDLFLICPNTAIF